MLSSPPLGAAAASGITYPHVPKPHWNREFTLLCVPIFDKGLLPDSPSPPSSPSKQPLQRIHTNQWNPKCHLAMKTKTFLLTLTSVTWGEADRAGQKLCQLHLKYRNDAVVFEPQSTKSSGQRLGLPCLWWKCDGSLHPRRRGPLWIKTDLSPGMKCLFFSLWCCCLWSSVAKKIRSLSSDPTTHWQSPRFAVQILLPFNGTASPVLPLSAMPFLFSTAERTRSTWDFSKTSSNACSMQSSSIQALSMLTVPWYLIEEYRGHRHRTTSIHFWKRTDGEFLTPFGLQWWGRGCNLRPCPWRSCPQPVALWDSHFLHLRFVPFSVQTMPPEQLQNEKVVASMLANGHGTKYWIMLHGWFADAMSYA